VNSTGYHTLKWRYVKDGSGSDGYDKGWVDYVQWTGPSPAQDPENWENITYKYDTGGRRTEKRVDGYSTRYVYDGGNVIAEDDGNGNLLRKYIYGPGVDQPICMLENPASDGIDVADSNAVYYYHYDALGSVVALSDSNGDSVHTYEYSVYGQVGASDPNFITNPYMFTGRRFDFETGLYYYRARYYNPYIGRFLQTDPVGYGTGMNLYLYCWNNPTSWVDSTGREPVRTTNNPGWYRDVWERADGHPRAAHWPSYSVWPYYFPMKRGEMICVPIAILNWWLTYDNYGETFVLPDEFVSLFGFNDEGALEYVKDLMDRHRFHDWSIEGINNFPIVQDIIDPDADPTKKDHQHENTTIVDEVPGFSVILDYVTKQKKAVMVGYDLIPGPGRAWHCVIIAPTPVSMLVDNPDRTISVIDGPRPATYSPMAFVSWWKDKMTNYGVRSEYIVGGVVPTPDPEEYE